jgi:hypothetical protein
MLDVLHKTSNLTPAQNIFSSKDTYQRWDKICEIHESQSNVENPHPLAGSLSHWEMADMV